MENIIFLDAEQEKSILRLASYQKIILKRGYLNRSKIKSKLLYALENTNYIGI